MPGRRPRPRAGAASAGCGGSGSEPRSIWQDAGGYPIGLGERVPVRYRLVIDCADPDRLARFWAAALGYELAPAPAGFAGWNEFYLALGVPEEELVDGADRISDPDGHGPASGSRSSPRGNLTNEEPISGFPTVAVRQLVGWQLCWSRRSSKMGTGSAGRMTTCRPTPLPSFWRSA